MIKPCPSKCVGVAGALGVVGRRAGPDVALARLGLHRTTVLNARIAALHAGYLYPAVQADRYEIVQN
eukprot:2225579-Pleurochrysis_carterae.AAC.3